MRSAALVWVSMSAAVICSGLYIPVREGLWQKSHSRLRSRESHLIGHRLRVLASFTAAPLGGWIYQNFPRGIYWVGIGMMGITMGKKTFNFKAFIGTSNERLFNQP